MKVIAVLTIVFLMSCQTNDNSNKKVDKSIDSQKLKIEYAAIFEQMDRYYTKDFDGFILQGLTTNIKDSFMIYLQDANSDINIDSTYVLNNKFQFKGKVNGYRHLEIIGKDYSPGKSIWVENAKMIFDARGTIFKRAKVLGSKLQDQDNEWFNTVKVLEIKKDSIGDIMKITPWYNVFRKISLGVKLTNYHIKIPKANKKFIRSHPDYLISAYYLSYLMHKISNKEAQELYNGLSKSMQESEYGEIVKFYLANPNELKVGDKYVDFKLTSQENSEVKLSSFKGRYVLLEFWASYCSSCEMENPNLLNAFKKYNKKGFEILSVSLDKNEITWKNSIKRYSMIWTNVSDLKGQSGDVALKYKIHSIPKNYLIDPMGTIIHMDLRGDNLQKVLEKIFE